MTKFAILCAYAVFGVLVFFLARTKGTRVVGLVGLIVAVIVLAGLAIPIHGITTSVTLGEWLSIYTGLEQKPAIQIGVFIPPLVGGILAMLFYWCIGKVAGSKRELEGTEID
jgi:hypothetical protein